MDKQKKSSSIEGEGSYVATHNYREGLEKSVQEGKSDELARKAQKAYDGPEGKELRAAEKAALRKTVKPGRKHQKK